MFFLRFCLVLSLYKCLVLFWFLLSSFLIPVFFPPCACFVTTINLLFFQHIFSCYFVFLIRYFFILSLFLPCVFLIVVTFFWETCLVAFFCMSHSLFNALCSMFSIIILLFLQKIFFLSTYCSFSYSVHASFLTRFFLELVSLFSNFCLDVFLLPCTYVPYSLLLLYNFQSFFYHFTLFLLSPCWSFSLFSIFVLSQFIFETA